MNLETRINAAMAKRGLENLSPTQVACLLDIARIQQAASMLRGLRGELGIQLPFPSGVDLAGPFLDEDEALAAAERRAADKPVVVLDEMATDESRSSGHGNEYFVIGYDGPDAALALAWSESWIALWEKGERQL